MFVWNERQRTEAQDLHDFPGDRVVIVGAPRFDSFFELGPQLTREAFHQPLGLDPSRPTLMYVCSSQFVSEGELPFVRTWIAAIRNSPFERLRGANIIVRPHPDIALLDQPDVAEEVRWPAMAAAKGQVVKPFGDDGAIVLRTSNRALQAFYECIANSAAVVGLNTSAELEAAIVGRPVYTVLADDADADGQSSTLHFHYLLEAHGGFVRVGKGLNDHLEQLDAEIRTPTDASVLRRFVGEFLRPHGIDRPVGPILAEAIERTFDGSPASAEAAEGLAQGLVQGLAPGPVPNLTPNQAPNLTPVSVTSQKYGYSLQIHAPRAGHRQGLDRGTVLWMRESIGIGDVVYDVHAGNGLYSMLAARYHGAVVVAIEPGYSAFTQLCDNLRLNGCDGNVMPLQAAVADFEGIGELKYPTGLAGQQRHTIRPRSWRVKRSAGDEGTFKQPVYALTLDSLVERCDLPNPNHLRLGNPPSALQVLAGAHRVLGLDSLKTIFFTLPDAEGRDAIARLAPLYWVVGRHTPISSGRAHVVLVKSSAPVTAGP
jgi:FkbM family methyltransferase